MTIQSPAGITIQATTSSTMAMTAKLYESSFGGLPHAPTVSYRALIGCSVDRRMRLERSHRHPMSLLEAIRAPQRPHLGELFDDVLFGLAAPGDLFEDRPLLLRRVGPQDSKGVDAVEQQIVESVLTVGCGLGRLRWLRRRRIGIAHRPQGSSSPVVRLEPVDVLQ
jgi:hypothetical protein